MADRAHSWTDWKIEELEKELDKIYSRAEKELEERAEKYFDQFSKQDDQKRALVEAGKLTEEEYQKWKTGKIMTGKHWTEMKEQAAEELLKTNQTAASYINDQLPSIYTRNYNQVADGINGAISGYSFEMVDSSTVRRLATDDTTLLPYKYIDGVKDLRWNTQKVNSEILQGILQGDSIPNLAKRLSNVTEMNRTSAIRNARTACTSAENKGRMDMMEDAEENGVHVQKKWIATHDARTRESHALLDGSTIDQDEEFDNGLMYPGDPNGDPEEVYNCRCTLGYKVVSFSKKDEAEQEKETEYEFVPAKTKEEAEEYISQYVDNSIFGAIGVDYTGVGLDAANEVNRTISDLQRSFDVGKIGGISAPAANTKTGKMLNGATAAYSPVRQSFFLNRKTFKSVADAEKAFAAERKAITDILTHPEKYDLAKASRTLRLVVENSKISGRATVPMNIEQALQHEFGHRLEKKVKSHALWENALKNMESYAPKISGYACSDASEYIAESFCSFMQGEGKTDPLMAEIFNSLRR